MVFSKSFRIAALIAFGALLGILATGSSDYSFSLLLLDPAAPWALLGRYCGETPAFAGLLLSTVIIYGSRKPDAPAADIRRHLAAVPCLAFFCFLVLWQPVFYYFENDPSGVPGRWLAAVIIGALVLLALSIWLGNCFPSTKYARMETAAWTFLLVVAAANLTVNGLKILWARPRMYAITGFSQFRYWYQAAGPTLNNNLQSFPSGHTANAFAAMAYSLFVPAADNRARGRKMLAAAGAAWGIVIALSRIVLGAHFLSDVVAGCGITICLFMLLSPNVISKIIKHN